MSRVYFHAQSGEAELWGGERAWLGSLCSDIATGVLNLRHNGDRLRDLIAAGHYLRDARYQDPVRFAESLALSLSVGYGPVLAWRGKEISTFSLLLNTACRVGGDALKLAARIHGQCEIHCYAEGIDRAWVAGIIDQGLTSGVFRRDLAKMGSGSPGWKA